MSQQYDPGFSYEKPKSGGGGCFKGCLIVSLILIVLLALGIWWIYKKFSNAITLDSTEIVTRVKDHYPTAVIPEGYTGRMGMRINIIFELDMMIFTKGEADVAEEGFVNKGDALILMTFKMPGDQNQNFDMEQINKGGKIIEKKRIQFAAGEYEFPAFLQVVESKEDGKKMTQIQVELSKNSIAVIQGEKDKVDEAALRTFLVSIAKDCPNAKKKAADDGEKKDANKQLPQ